MLKTDRRPRENNFLCKPIPDLWIDTSWPLCLHSSFSILYVFNHVHPAPCQSHASKSATQKLSESQEGTAKAQCVAHDEATTLNHQNQTAE